MLRSGVVAQNIRFLWRAGPRFAGVGGFSAELVADLMLHAITVYDCSYRGFGCYQGYQLLAASLFAKQVSTCLMPSHLRLRPMFSALPLKLLMQFICLVLATVSHMPRQDMPITLGALG